MNLIEGPLPRQGTFIIRVKYMLPCAKNAFGEIYTDAESKGMFFAFKWVNKEVDA